MRRQPDYYSLVFMDLQMPVLDGYETTKRLRANPRYSALPIVAMTAHVMMEEQERCLALGMRGHIGKPIDPDELYRVVASFCRRDGERQAACRRQGRRADHEDRRRCLRKSARSRAAVGRAERRRSRQRGGTEAHARQPGPVL